LPQTENALQFQVVELQSMKRAGDANRKKHQSISQTAQFQPVFVTVLSESFNLKQCFEKLTETHLGTDGFRQYCVPLTLIQNLLK
jgi:hypothetical protein